MIALGADATCGSNIYRPSQNNYSNYEYEVKHYTMQLAENKQQDQEPNLAIEDAANIDQIKLPTNAELNSIEARF